MSSNGVPNRQQAPQSAPWYFFGALQCSQIIFMTILAFPAQERLGTLNVLDRPPAANKAFTGLPAAAIIRALVFTTSLMRTLITLSPAGLFKVLTTWSRLSSTEYISIVLPCFFA
jgi:hypothetical protein